MEELTSQKGCRLGGTRRLFSVIDLMWEGCGEEGHARQLIREDAATSRCCGLDVGGVWRGRSRTAVDRRGRGDVTMLWIRCGSMAVDRRGRGDVAMLWWRGMAGTAVDLRGRGDVAMLLIGCGRGVGRNGRVSYDDFQLHCFARKKTKIGITRQPTCLFRGRQGRRVGAMASKTMSQLAAQNSMNSQRSKGMNVRGLGKPSGGCNAFVSFDRFHASCPEDVNSIRNFDRTLIAVDATGNDDVWVAVYRSNNNLPNVFVRDAFFDAMKASTTVQEGRRGIRNSSFLLRRHRLQTIPTFSIIDSIRCTLKKEDTNPDCDGGSEHAEEIGVCIDELVLYFLQQYILSESPKDNNVRFDGSIRFQGTLVSGKLLEARGFRKVSVLSSDMHSYESDYVGALTKYADCSTSKETAKNPGSRERALTIVIYLGRFDREDEINRVEQKMTIKLQPNAPMHEREYEMVAKHDEQQNNTIDWKTTQHGGCIHNMRCILSYYDQTHFLVIAVIIVQVSLVVDQHRDEKVRLTLIKSINNGENVEQAREKSGKQGVDIAESPPR
ncbi:hypothetical protein HJC23_009358 [Cyclotella cryptica]|uniref:Uncharacterized protein n=1 Tax=Cyclotella cryptica TaxID=29204 RepID=A0ABD3QSP3_9STRA